MTDPGKDLFDVEEAAHRGTIILVLVSDAAQRAIQVAAFGWKPAQEASGTDWMEPFLLFGANDPYDAVRIIVEDEGPGIPTAHLERVFERFYRIDAARSREAGGTGLGLSIVKHLVGAHGGEVGIESEVGEGTRVWLVFPNAISPVDTPPAD